MFKKLKLFAPILMALALVAAKPSLAAVADLVTTPASPIDFMPTAVGGSDTIIVTISKSGGSNFTIDALPNFTLGGTDPGEFSVPDADNNCDGATVNPTCTFNVVFTPTSEGAKTATVTINSTAANNPVVVTLNGTGTAEPFIDVSANPLDFGTIFASQTSDMQLTITNNGLAGLNFDPTTPFVIGGTDPTNFTVTDATDCTDNDPIAPAGSCVLDLTFDPMSVAGTYSATLTINSDASNDPVVVDLDGVADPDEAALSFTPDPVNFPPTENGATSANIDVTVENVGTAELTSFDSIGLGGTNPGNFAIDTTGTDDCNDEVTSLMPGETCTVAVNFSPDAVMSFTATLDIAFNDGVMDPDSASVNLNGDGIAADQPVVDISPATTDFGNVGVGADSGAETITVTNIGGSVSTLNITSVGITDSGNFSIDSTDCNGQALTQGQSCTADVIFSPQAEGTANGTFDVTSDAASSPDSADLTGNGVSAANPVLSVDPTTLDFGNVTVKTTGTEMVTVTNTGNPDLVIGQATLGGDNADNFSIGEDFCSGQTLSFGESCTIDIAVFASVLSQLTAELNIPSNDPLSPTVVAIFAAIVAAGDSGGGCSLSTGLPMAANAGYALWILALGGLAWFRVRRK